MVEKLVMIREYNEEKDRKMVGKLERKCEILCNKEVFAFTNMLADPLRRIRLYPFHVLLVAELCENGEMVGVVRGCIKFVETRFGDKQVKLGCILGLRVSPNHRRMGIGLELVKSVENWLIDNGADYTFLATEKKNIASINLFTSKCNYSIISSLTIFMQSTTLPMIIKNSSQDLNIEKLQLNQAISLYNKKLKNKDIYPADLEAILKEKLNLGTWVCFFKTQEQERVEIIAKNSNSWAVFSVWNSCEGCKTTKSNKPFKFFDKIFPFGKFKFPLCDYLQEDKLFGYLFVYGIYGEGLRLQELMKSMWDFAVKMAQNVRGCRMVISELGASDPLMQYVPHDSASLSLIDDLWLLKKVNGSSDDDESVVMGQVGNVFVDPRDF